MKTITHGSNTPIKLGSLAALLAAVHVADVAAVETCHMLECTIVGTAGDDFLKGTSGDDVICGLEGNDTIRGMAGDDLICGGAGDDVISGDNGLDILVGGSGNDQYKNLGDEDYVFDAPENMPSNYTKLSSEPVASTSKTTQEASTFSLMSGTMDQGMLLEGAAMSGSHSFLISGNKIYAPDGSEFIPRGVSIFPWHTTARDIDGIVDCWKFNSVRLHAWIMADVNSNWKDHLVYIDEPLIFDPQQTQYRTYDIVPLIEAYTSRNIVVIVDIHDLIGGYFEGEHLTNLLRFAEQFAERFKDNPYVWFDIHNEPGSWDGQNGDFSKWRTEMPLVLDAVRAIAPTMPLIVSGSAWGQDTGPTWNAALVNPAKSALLANSDIINGYANLITTFHMYDQWVFGYAKLEDFVKKLLASTDAPIYVGEYGSSNGQNTLAASNYLHQLVQQPAYASVGRNVWIWSAWDANDLVSIKDGSGYHVDSCVMPSNLTPLGQLVWDDNHR